MDRWRVGLWLVAVLAGWLLVGVESARAEKILVRNRTPAPVAVQGATLVRGMLVRGPVSVVLPNDAAPPIALPGDKVIIVYDARNANRILIQVPVPPSPLDVIFDVVPDPTSPTGVRLDRAVR